jgi:hypothetical protein
VVVLVAALVVAGAIAWGCIRIAGELKEARREIVRARTLAVLRAFVPASAAAAADPRALLVWEPLAKAARQIFPDEFVQLDRACGAAFPFGAERIESAHAQWTADWLAWERSHDADYKLKAAAVEEEIARSAGSPVVRARLDAIEREKLELYQRRYAEYVRVAKALQSLTTAS